MNNQDYIINLLKYFSKFVPKTVLQDIFQQPEHSRNAGYNELVAEIMSHNDLSVFDKVGTFIVSANRKFVIDSVKKSTGIVLFVEYGEFSFNPSSELGVTEKIGITVAHEYTMTNNDNINEALLMNECNNILNQILLTMEADQEELEACGLSRLIRFPANIFPVDPESFSDRTGWTALFSNESSVL